MIPDLRRELEVAIHGETPFVDIVAMLRRYKAHGITQNEVYSILESLRSRTAPEAVDDRILEIADFVAGFGSPHMKIWND